MEEATLSIQGMHCEGCVASVTRALRAVPGVEPLAVKVGEARVSLDPARASLGAVREAIEAAGFDVLPGPP
jgi:copper chaperone CopZ